MFHLASTALQWLPGTNTWSALPDLPAGRDGAASVRLPDGRTMLIGGVDDNDQVLASVLVLAADGSGWSDLPSLTGPRAYLSVALVPDGKVLVAGGMSSDAADTALDTAELWDPATQKWTALPPMAHKRTNPAACVLPSGRVAVVGGSGTDGKTRKDGEVFDPVKCEWEPLGADTAHHHGNISAVAVAGGLLAVGMNSLNPAPELYDEGSGRWLTLPHATVEQRGGTGLASVPASALVGAAAAPH
jgi:N-acetylneuraminic acid mutarotase